MSSTRTVDDLQILLAQHDIEIKNANAVTAQYGDKPRIVHALYDLIEAFYKNEALADQLGVGKTIQDLLNYIPDVIIAIEEEQKRNSENKLALTGDDLVINVLKNITALFNPTKWASLARKEDSPQHKGEEMIAPFQHALNQAQQALPATSTHQKGYAYSPAKLGELITDNFESISKFLGCVAILGGIACIIAGILSANPVGLAIGIYGAAHLFGTGGVLFKSAYDANQNNKTKNAVEARATEAPRTQDTHSSIQLGVFRNNNQQSSNVGTTQTTGLAQKK